ncbi:MAG TPA: MBL fold metallo-hydrolase [Solirubrobacterales bacterium]|nr:MBL fold metallo-hydrolase [Solirubrobacterales bacterium]
MRVLRPADNVYAFYDGRSDDPAAAGGDTWVDAGALSLGIASYAIVDGDEALVYDTHVSIGHAEQVRRRLEEQGVRKLTVVLSHWHLDHIAGNEVFADCEILAGTRTAELLTRHREAIEAGTLEGPPAIKPLTLPTRLLGGPTTIAVGDTEVELLPFEIHSDDATLLWLPGQRLLLAGDAVEDTITYVTEPKKLTVHVEELDRLAALGAERILPNHGSAEAIAGGGYDEGLIRATQEYVRALLRIGAGTEAAGTELRELISGGLEAGSISYFPPYEDVHRENLALISR